MRRWMTAILACALILAAAGCAQGEPVVKTTIEKTPLEQSEELLANGQEIVLYPYYEMSDGTWQAAASTSSGWWSQEGCATRSGTPPISSSATWGISHLSGPGRPAA